MSLALKRKSQYIKQLVKIPETSNKDQMSNILSIVFLFGLYIKTFDYNNTILLGFLWVFLWRRYVETQE
jgi:hypothetical protein